MKQQQKVNKKYRERKEYLQKLIMIAVWRLVLAKPQIMGKLQGTRHGHLLPQNSKVKIDSLFLKKKGRRRRRTAEFQAYSRDEKYQFRKIEFRESFLKKNKREKKNREGGVY